MNRKIVIGLSWPYANNNLHLGHIASSLPADVLARYHRMSGDDVCFVGGTDSHGTKIALRAKQEGVQPIDIVNKYDKNFRENWDIFNIQFDLFAKTADKEHADFVIPLFEKMYKNGFIVERTEKRPYCSGCNKFVADTEIEIVCPACGSRTKADNCDCGFVPTDQDLIGGTCLVCGKQTEIRENKVLSFQMKKLEKELKEHLERNRDKWRANTINETEKYLKDLRDRDFSRDLDWGMKIPFDGFEEKKIYCWWEALMGYVSDVYRLSVTKGFNFDDFWKGNKSNQRIYMVHAKDNITFHTLLLPAMLIAIGEDFSMPNYIVSSEYLLNGTAKISKTEGGFEALNISKEYDPESLRFFLIANGPEKKDASWQPDVFKAVHNGEVVNKIGNIVNRTLKFKGLEQVPNGQVAERIKSLVLETYSKTAELIEKFEFKKATDAVMDLVEAANKYYDDEKPWAQAKEEDKTGFNNTIFTCCYIIANLANLLYPFMPQKASKIAEFLKLDEKREWKEKMPVSGINLENIEPLFTRLV